MCKSRSPTRHSPVARTVIDAHSLEHGKSIVRIDRETGSYESKGPERKDAARRLTRARKLGHLMHLSHSHLT